MSEGEPRSALRRQWGDEQRVQRWWIAAKRWRIALRDQSQMGEEEVEKDYRPRPAARRQCRARPEAQEEQRRKTRRVGWVDQAETKKVISLRPWYDLLWHRSPGTRVERDRCARVVPVYAGRLVGEPGRPRFAMNKFWCGKCEDEQQEPLSRQQEEDEREARGGRLRGV